MTIGTLDAAYAKLSMRESMLGISLRNVEQWQVLMKSAERA